MRMLVVPSSGFVAWSVAGAQHRTLGIPAQGMSGAHSWCRDSAGTGTPRHTPSVGLQLH